MKKVCLLLLALLLLCTGCTVQPAQEETKYEKETTGMTEFEITYYWGPHGDQMIDETFWKAVSECGFTAVPLENGSTKKNKTALGLMKQYGLKCCSLWDNRIYNLIHSEEEPSQEVIDSVVYEVVEDYKDFDNVTGWWLFDEPSTARFDRLAKIKDAFLRLDPDRETFIDLFPNYASSGALGAKNYETYVSEYIEKVKPTYVCYDHYHFLENGARAGFYTNLEQIRSAALDSRLDYMTIVLLTKHLGYGDLTYAQILWEVNMALAYGVKRVSYFTFILDQYLLDDGWTNGCMSYTGEIYPHYYDVQKINAAALPLGRELFGKNSEAVFHVSEMKLEEGCTPYSGYGTLGAIDGTSLVLGFFDDGSIYVVNKKFKTENTFRLPDVTSLEFFDVSSASWLPYETKTADGVYEITLEAGAGILLRIQ